MSPVTVPVLICGLLTCPAGREAALVWAYGETLPEKVREVLQQFDDQSRHQRTRQDKIRLIVQAIIGVWLVTALALHLAEVGLIGLSVIILASLTGVTDEHAIGKAFTESLPIHRTVDGVFLGSRGDYRPTTVFADYSVCVAGIGTCSAVVVLYFQRTTAVIHFG